MDRGFGGPVWHVSVSSKAMDLDGLEATAREALSGVGDALVGEWVERGPIDLPTAPGQIVHIRRRLTAKEQGKVGPLIDYRGTQEFRSRAVLASRNLGIPIEQALQLG